MKEGVSTVVDDVLVEEVLLLMTYWLKKYCC